jgi:hypothetical protein
VYNKPADLKRPINLRSERGEIRFYWLDMSAGFNKLLLILITWFCWHVKLKSIALLLFIWNPWMVDNRYVHNNKIFLFLFSVPILAYFLDDCL